MDSSPDTTVSKLSSGTIGEYSIQCASGDGVAIWPCGRLQVVTILYNEPANVDLATVVGEVHAHPYPLVQVLGGTLQVAFMTEADLAKDQVEPNESSYRFGVMDSKGEEIRS